jgi:glutathione S-transferase
LTDKLRVYSMLYCPYAQRTRLVLEAKHIDYETINIDLSKKPQWYLNLNPAGLVPCLHLSKGMLIPESLITAEYLDEAYPDNKLTPNDPYTKALHKLIVEGFSKVITAFYKLVRKTDDNADKLLSDALEGAVEKKLTNNYFGGKFNFNKLNLILRS